MIVFLLALTAHIPSSTHPEKAFLRLLRRFFRHAEFLMSRMALDWEQRRGISGRWKTLLYRNDILELPQKLAMWGGMIDHRLFPDAAPEQVQALTTSLQTIAYRISDLMDAREHPQADLLVRELLDDVRPWRLVIQRLFNGWVTDPSVEPADELKVRLTKRLYSLETRINEALSLPEQAELSPLDYENFYRLLGGYRSLSEALVAHARLAQDINWKQWKEARF
jgi:hypothetical protein